MVREVVRLLRATHNEHAVSSTVVSDPVPEMPLLVTVTSEQLTLAVHPESMSRPVRAGVPGDVRELRAGDRSVFELR